MMDSAEVSTLCLAHLPAHASCSKLDAALADFELSPFRGVALSVLAKIIEQTIFRGLSKAELKTSRSILSNAIAARREQPVDKRESSS